MKTRFRIEIENNMGVYDLTPYTDLHRVRTFVGRPAVFWWRMLSLESVNKAGESMAGLAELPASLGEFLTLSSSASLPSLKWRYLQIDPTTSSWEITASGVVRQSHQIPDKQTLRIELHGSCWIGEMTRRYVQRQYGVAMDAADFLKQVLNTEMPDLAARQSAAGWPGIETTGYVDDWDFKLQTVYDIVYKVAAITGRDFWLGPNGFTGGYEDLQFKHYGKHCADLEGSSLHTVVSDDPLDPDTDAVFARHSDAVRAEEKDDHGANGIVIPSVAELLPSVTKLFCGCGGRASFNLGKEPRLTDMTTVTVDLTEPATGGGNVDQGLMWAYDATDDQLHPTLMDAPDSRLRGSNVALPDPAAALEYNLVAYTGSGRIHHGARTNSASGAVNPSGTAASTIDISDEAVYFYLEQDLSAGVDSFLSDWQMYLTNNEFESSVVNIKARSRQSFGEPKFALNVTQQPEPDSMILTPGYTAVIAASGSYDESGTVGDITAAIGVQANQDFNRSSITDYAAGFSNRETRIQSGATIQDYYGAKLGAATDAGGSPSRLNAALGIDDAPIEMLGTDARLKFGNDEASRNPGIGWNGAEVECGDSGTDVDFKVNGDIHITGKATIDGIIDPPGLNFTSHTVGGDPRPPALTTAGSGVWQKDAVPPELYFYNGTTDVRLDGGSSVTAGDGLDDTAGTFSVDASDIAGDGLEDDGSENLRIASTAAGDGLTGGGGSALSVEADNTTGGDTAPVSVGSNGVGVDVTDLDGDHLPIDYTPSNFTPDDSPAESAGVGDLAAYLAGIDDALGSAFSDPMTATGDIIYRDDVSGTTRLPIGSLGELLTVNADGEPGWEELNGDHVLIDFNPGNYTPDTTPAEASHVDHLAAHLYGIDVALGDLESLLKAVTVSYTGSGSSGKTVSLAGINRAHWIVAYLEGSSGASVAVSAPLGGTGTQRFRFYDSGDTYNELSLDAPPAGNNQTLTINNTRNSWNSSGDTYRLLVIGTSS